MLITLHPGVDLDVAPGSRLGDLRPDLARVACRPEVATAPLEVDGVLLGDDHRVGTRPLLPGATLRATVGGTHGREGRPARAHQPASAATVDPDVAALRAPWHVAVLTGPDCGGLLPLEPGSPLVLTHGNGPSVVVTLRASRRPGLRTPGAPGPAAGAGAGAEARVRLRVGRDPGSAPGRATVQDGTEPSVQVHRRSPDGRQRRVRRGAARRWRPGHVLRVGAATYDLRPRPDLDEWDVASGLAHPARPVPRGLLDPASLTMAITPAVGSLALAAGTRQPLFALLALVGPLTLLVPLLARRRRTAARGPRGPGGDPGVPHGSAPGRAGADPVRSPEGAGAAGRRPSNPPSSQHERAPVPGAVLDRSRYPGPHPADLMTAAFAAHHATEARPPATSVANAQPLGGPAPRAVVPSAQGARLPDGCVAVVGPRGARLAAARTLLLAQVASGAEVDAVHPDDLASDWSWLRWLPGARRSDLVTRAPQDGGGSRPRPVRVVVVDVPPGPGTGSRGATSDRLAEAVETWWARRTGTERLILLAADRRSVPAWCRTLLDTARHTWHLADGTVEPAPEVGVGVDRAERYARHVAAAARLGRWPAGSEPAGPVDPTDPAHPDLAPSVSLAGLLHVPSPHEPGAWPAWVTGRWSPPAARPRQGLAVPIGTDAQGRTVQVDLVRDGPHALVAGTTGAGKSELLQSLVLALALTHSPRDLAFALVDFKGGAGFGACGGLPHVVGQVTDLEPGLAGRALTGLRAELRRREHALAEAGVSDVDDLPHGTLPRLVVVIDEFRALADDLPDFLPGLLRLASQGRSLGVHLVLATQRPAGAVTADMRANISLRLALRQLDPGDSRDVIDSPHAALIPTGLPGRAVLRRGNGPPLALQCAHAGTAAPPADVGVRAAGRWGTPRDTALARVGPASDPVTDLVAAAVAAADAARIPAHAPPWLPALPARVTPSDLRGVLLEGAAPDSLPLALADLPDQQQRGLVSWLPQDGHLAVVGRPRSGRSTALRALAVSALDRGWDVHAVGAPTLTDGLTQHPRCGTVVARHDARRVARLVDLLLSDARGRPTLVLLDDVEDLRASLGRLASGAGADQLGRLLAEGPAAGVHVALAGGSPGLAGLSQRVGPRLVLASAAVPDDVAHGVPSRLAGRGGRPGRAVWLGTGEAVECQVVVDAAPGGAAGVTRDPDGGTGRDGPVRLLPLPRYVAEADLAVVEVAGHAVGAGTAAPRSPVLPPGRLVVGRGGDHAGPVHLDVERGALVVGPPGSGRSSALLVLARQAHATGRLRAVVSPDARFEDLVRGGARDLHVVTGRSSAEVRKVLGVLSGTALVAGDVVVLDDLDLLVHAFPLEADVLIGLVRDGVTVLASASTAAAATAHRGPVAELRGARNGLVLAPEERGSSEVFGRPLGWSVDPEVAPAGRAVAIRGNELVPVQVASPGAVAAASEAGQVEAPRAEGRLRPGSAVGADRVTGRRDDDRAQHETHEHYQGERHGPDPAGRDLVLEPAEGDHDLEELPRGHG
ncbi:FtsK/SpoIIIE domain-containing protein [Oerskovia sp. NPDC056781]|uniref:FtsK/SpoIIIE domain-containing protein n=1 Tax=Oerskovia sp. NPDC056781 TaxID=3345942 RepID=UPI00366D8192